MAARAPVAAILLAAACASAPTEPAPSEPEPGRSSSAGRRGRRRPPPVPDEAPSRPPWREPFSAVVNGTGTTGPSCGITADESVVVAPGQVFRVTCPAGPGLGFRATLEAGRTARFVEGGSPADRPRIGWVPIPGHFQLVPYPQDVHDSPAFEDGATIELTPLGPIPGSADEPRRSGVSDVPPLGGRGRH